LDEVQRQTFILRYTEEMSLAEIAEIMECPEGTVKSRLFYILKKLAKPLEVYKP
jgi:RNA polymerase sigma-70 factor (ECF subfamily)